MPHIEILQIDRALHYGNDLDSHHDSVRAHQRRSARRLAPVQHETIHLRAQLLPVEPEGAPAATAPRRAPPPRPPPPPAPRASPPPAPAPPRPPPPPPVAFSTSATIRSRTFPRN